MRLDQKRKRIGYLRVSTQEQRPDRQIDGLRDLCDEHYIETLSAARPRRPVYDMVIGRLRPGDSLVVWDLDRAFRSVVDALTQAERLRQAGIDFHIVNLKVNTSTPSGMLLYTVMSAFAEFERRLLVQRTKEGLAAAKRRGVRLGRPPKLDGDQLGEVRRRLLLEESPASLAREFGVAPWTLSRSLKKSEKTNMG